MDDGTMMILSFLLFMGLFAGVGLASMRVKKDTTDDYLVAGRGMHPGLAALSAVSTWNSGYMFIGFIWFVYMTGLAAIWIAVVSTLGQVLAWLWLYKHIQQEGQRRGVRSLSSLVASVQGAPEAKLAAVLSVLFLSVYAAAQLTSGGVALFAMLGWSKLTGILIGFVLVVAYCYAGGIRASIWTDAIQSCVMIVGSTMLAWVALGEVGGISGLFESLEKDAPALVSLTPPSLGMGISLWIFAFFLGGLGVAGQPQVVSRVMTLGDDNARKQAALWFFVWQTPFIALMFVIGLACRVVFPPEMGFDAEMGLPLLAMEVLDPFFVGLILASIFAATMSTADSQVLACTAAVTDDIKPEWSQDHKKTKMVTLAVAALATAISVGGLYIPGGDRVFALVVLAVYGLGGIFIPMLLIRIAGYEPDSKHAIIMMTSALIAVIVWRLTGLNEHVFESVPGMGAAFAAHFLLCKFRDESESYPLGNWKMPTQQVMAAGLAILLVGVIAAEVTYLKVKPEAQSSDNGQYELVFSTSEWVSTETVVMSDGETYTFSVDVDDSINVFSVVELVISYSETDETATSQCDEIGVSLDFSAVNGPHDEMDDTGGAYTDCSGNQFVVGWIITDSSLAEIAAKPDPRFNGTEDEMVEMLTYLGDNSAMQGTYSADITLNVNNGNFLFGESGEEVTMMWRGTVISPIAINKIA